MDFKNEKPIYQQIVDYVCERIAAGQWAEEERIPSVRDLATQLQVNPNTVMRAYERLQMSEVIANTRGVGYFVSAGAKQQVTALKRAAFFETALPELFTAMQTLGISWDEVEACYRRQKGE